MPHACQQHIPSCERLQVEQLKQQAEEELSSVNKADRVGWLSHPCGRALAIVIRACIEEQKENWANGTHTGDSIEATMQLNAEAIGFVKGVDSIAEWLGTLPFDVEELESDE